MMRALSLWQPFASLMAVGAKRIETRGYATAVRGEVAIHAAKHWDDTCQSTLISEACQQALGVIEGRGHVAFFKQHLPFGCVVAVLNLDRCITTTGVLAWVVHPLTNQERSFGNYESGRYAWLTSGVRRLAQPVPCVGRQGFFHLPAEVEAAVRRQL
jgi:hypothetical protein